MIKESRGGSNYFLKKFEKKKKWNKLITKAFKLPLGKSTFHFPARPFSSVFFSLMAGNWDSQGHQTFLLSQTDGENFGCSFPSKKKKKQKQKKYKNTRPLLASLFFSGESVFSAKHNALPCPNCFFFFFLSVALSPRLNPSWTCIEKLKQEKLLLLTKFNCYIVLATIFCSNPSPRPLPSLEPSKP